MRKVFFLLFLFVFFGNCILLSQGQEEFNIKEFNYLLKTRKLANNNLCVSNYSFNYYAIPEAKNEISNIFEESFLSFDNKFTGVCT
jgi:hypothetical protein